MQWKTWLRLSPRHQWSIFRLSCGANIIAIMAFVILPSVQRDASADAGVAGIFAPAGISPRAGFPALQPYGSFFSSPTVVDLTGDGRKEILTADSTGCVWAFSATGGALLPGFPWKTGGVCDNAPRINSPLAIGDIDGDGTLEVVAGTRGSGLIDGTRGKVYVWKRDGTLVTGWPKEMAWATITNGNFPEVQTVTMANITGDSKLEIIAASTNEAGSGTDYAPNVYAWNLNGSAVSGFPVSSPKGSGLWGHLAAADINGDGYADVIIGRDEIYVYAINGQGQNLSGWPMQTYLDDARRTWGTDKYIEFTRSGPAVGDLDGDGTMELVIAGKLRDPQQNHDQIASAVMVAEPNGQRRTGWNVAKVVGPRLPNSAFSPNNQVALADLDGDSTLEIVVTFDDGTIRAFRENGDQLWSHNYANGRSLYASEVAIGDVTGDGVLDVVFGTYSYDGTANSSVGLWAVAGTTGQPLAGWPLALPNEGTGTTTAVRGIMAGPTLDDLDGDCQVEIMAHSKGGSLYVWNTTARVSAGSLAWPTARLTPLRTANRLRGVVPTTCGASIGTATSLPATVTSGLPSATMPAATSLPATATRLPATATNAPSTAPWTPGATATSGLPTATMPAATATSLRATATRMPGATATTGPVSGPIISRLSLINATTDQPIAVFDPLRDGATIDLGIVGPALNIVALTTPASVGSVGFVLDGGTRTENGAPYALAGNTGTDYAAWTPAVGIHTLVVTAYTSANRTGIAGPPVTVRFTVTSPPPASGRTILPPDEGFMAVYLPLITNGNAVIGMR